VRSILCAVCRDRSAYTLTLGAVRVRRITAAKAIHLDVSKFDDLNRYLRLFAVNERRITKNCRPPYLASYGRGQHLSNEVRRPAMEVLVVGEVSEDL
jgi:hypothetical protein